MTYQRNDTPEPLAGNLSPADRAMLERAAKAAGIRVKWDEGTKGFIRLSDSGLDVDSWNPLDHEDDTMALAAHFRMSTRHVSGRAVAEFGSVWDNTQHYGSYAMPYAEAGGDVVKAMRRAITGAAAAYEPPKLPHPGLDAMERKIDNEIFEAMFTPAHIEAMQRRRAAAKEVEARVAETLRVRLNALIHAPVMMKNDERSRAEVDRVVREVVDAEVPPPPFKVKVDMTTDTNRVNLFFEYPLAF